MKASISADLATRVERALQQQPQITGSDGPMDFAPARPSVLSDAIQEFEKVQRKSRAFLL